jgi:hypothetical protein
VRSVPATPLGQTLSRVSVHWATSQSVPCTLRQRLPSASFSESRDNDVAAAGVLDHPLDGSVLIGACAAHAAGLPGPARQLVQHAAHLFNGLKTHLPHRAEHRLYIRAAQTEDAGDWTPPLLFCELPYTVWASANCRRTPAAVKARPTGGGRFTHGLARFSYRMTLGVAPDA